MSYNACLKCLSVEECDIPSCIQLCFTKTADDIALYWILKLEELFVERQCFPILTPSVLWLLWHTLARFYRASETLHDIHRAIHAGEL